MVKFCNSGQKYSRVSFEFFIHQIILKKLSLFSCETVFMFNVSGVLNQNIRVIFEVHG